LVDDLSRTREATNDLFDLAHRHLSAAHIDMRPLAVPPAAAESALDPRVRLLSKVEMFEVLGDEDLRQLAARLSRHEYEASQTIVTADQISTYLLIVASGVLSVTVDRGNGNASQPHPVQDKVEIARLGPEEAFGESGVLAGLPMTVDITALTRVVLYRLDKEELSPLLKARPELGHSMCRLLSTRQDYSRTFIEHQVAEVKTEGGLFQWLREGMRRLHELTS
jgi:CRP-like cAMP-binding protein